MSEQVTPAAIEGTPFDYEAWRTRLDALNARDVLPKGLAEDPPVEPEDFEIS